jgi:hypothetical protein
MSRLSRDSAFRYSQADRLTSRLAKPGGVLTCCSVEVSGLVRVAVLLEEA